MRAGGLGVWTGLALWASWTSLACGTTPVKSRESLPSKDIPWSAVTARHKDSVQFLLDKSTVSARGPAEVFAAKPAQYQWLLDHPDRAVVAWRRLGAKCVSITAKGENTFAWNDDAGSEVTWETVARTVNARVWLAEGKVRPGPLFPLVPVKALVVLRHQETKMPDGAPALQHQTDLFIHTDSKTAHMVMRMIGPAATRMTEEGLGQLQLFFSGLAWYLERHPDEAKGLLKD